MFNITEFRQRADRLTDLLPWALLVRPGVVLNKDGSFLQVLTFRGPDLESSTDAQLVSATARLNNALKRLGSGWAIYIEARRQQALGYPEEGAFPDPVSWLVDAERRDLFEREEEHYESHYFLSFQYLSEKQAVSKLSKYFISGQEDEHEHDYHQALDFFVGAVARVFDILKDFMYEVSFLDDSETLTYLHDCISTKRHKVKLPDVPVYLDSILADTPLIGGLEPRLGEAYLKTVSVLGFPASSVPAILDQLNHLPIEYRWVTRYIPMDKIEAEKVLKNYRRQWFSKRKGLMNIVSEVFSKTESAMTDTAALRKSQDADEAMLELADDHVSFGYFTATVTVWDEAKDVAIEKSREVERVLNGLGFTVISESMNAIEAWLSSLPGQVNANVRMPLVHSLNLAHMMPFSALWAGPEKNKHLDAPPLLYARTTGNTPFRLSNHIGDVGHQMIIGPTGAGKSVLMNTMALQFLRYKNAQVFIFDKGGSFMAATYGVGGHYYQVGSQQQSEGLVFQPLSRVDQNEERVWSQDWICGLMRNENIEITPDIKETIWDALTNLSTVPKEQRTLTGLKALLQDTKLRQALDTYCLGGPYGEILDADTEAFYDTNWQCFEMEDLMQVPDVVAPVLAYIFHVLEKRFDGRPTLMILDEAWLFLDHPIFQAKIREWLKTLRKYNVSVIFATQSVDDTLNSKIASALIESCPSRIFLPNDRSLEPNVRGAYEQLGLNGRQIQILGGAIPKRQYYFESHKGNSLFDLGLGKIAQAFAAASSPQDKKLVKDTMEKFGQENYALEYLRAKNLGWAADILKERMEA